MVERGLAGEPCPHCGGRGWVVESDGGAGSARQCECVADGLVPRLLDAAAIPPRYRDCTLDGFEIWGDDPNSRASLVNARQASRRYVDDFLDARLGGPRANGLLYIGPPGVGKTHLAVAVLVEIIRRYRLSGVFVDFTVLLHEIQATFDAASDGSQELVLAPVREAPILVVDELGAQKPSPWVNEVLYLIMNHRYTHRRPTLFTTNFLLDEDVRGGGSSSYRDLGAAHPRLEMLSQRIRPTLLSRLYEMAQAVRIDAPDFRRPGHRLQQRRGGSR